MWTLKNINEREERLLRSIRNQVGQTPVEVDFLDVNSVLIELNKVREDRDYRKQKYLLLQRH